MGVVCSACGGDRKVRIPARAKALTAGRHGRLIFAVTAVLTLLAGVKVATWFGPAGTGLVAGPVIAGLLVLLARRLGLSWDDLGLARRAVRRGALWAGIAVVVVAAVLMTGFAVPWIRAIFLDVKYQLDAGSVLVTALLVVPMTTILLEEIAFRGVLFGLLHQRRRTAWAFAVSSSLFGLWHILPALPAGQFEAVAAIVGITAALGLVLCELRRRSGSLLAAVAGHWAANGLGVVYATLLWSST